MLKLRVNCIAAITFSQFFTDFRHFLHFLAFRPNPHGGFTERLTDNGVSRPVFRQAPCGFKIFCCWSRSRLDEDVSILERLEVASATPNNASVSVTLHVGDEDACVGHLVANFVESHDAPTVVVHR